MVFKFQSVILLIVLAVAPTLGGKCDDIGSLQDRVRKSYADFDLDNNGEVSSSEVIQYFRKHDLNQDGCLTRDEYSKIDLNNFSKELFETDYDLFVGPMVCPIDEDIITKTFFPILTYKRLQTDIIQISRKFCSDQPELRSTNCECVQLKDACLDEEFSGLDECRGDLDTPYVKA